MRAVGNVPSTVRSSLVKTERRHDAIRQVERENKIYGGGYQPGALKERQGTR